MTGQQLPSDLAELTGGTDLRLLIVRHAETQFNVDHVMQGWSDSPITDRGHEQIAALGQALQHVQIDAAFSSDLPRTRTTAAGISDARDVPLDYEFREDLREWNFGGHEAQPSVGVWARMFAKHGLEVDRELSALRELAKTMTWSEMFDGIAELDETGQSEKAAATVVRADTALAHVISTTCAAAAGESRTALIVSHGGFITSMLRQLTPEVVPNVILPNCSISSVRVAGAGWTLEGVGVEATAFQG